MRLIFLKNLQNQKNNRKRKRSTFSSKRNYTFNERQKVLNAFESEIFPKGKQTQEKRRPSILASQNMNSPTNATNIANWCS